MAKPNVVIGAGGPTGLECVKRLLQATDQPVRAVVRDVAKYAGKFPEDSGGRLQVVQGDVEKPESLGPALENADGVIFAASGRGYWSAAPVDRDGVANTAGAAKAAGCRRVVLVSSMLVTPANRWNFIRLMLNNIRWGLMDAKYAGEEALRASGIEYTVVRPGGLTNEPPAKDLIIPAQGDRSKGPSRISRADVAAVCVEALTNPKARNVTMEVTSYGPLGDKVYDSVLKSMWDGLVPDAS